MNIKQPKTIRLAAGERLQETTCDTQRIVRIHTAVAIGISVLLTLIHFVANRQIGATGGLSGIGTRSILTTIQTATQTIATIASPFWQWGFVAAALAFARKESCTPAILTRGFLRFRPLLGLMLLQLLVCIGISVGCIQLCSMIFVMSPLSTGFMELMEPYLQDTTVLSGAIPAIDEAVMEQMSQAMLPVIILAVVLIGLLLIPVRLRFRMAEYIALDDPQSRSLGALLLAVKKMRKKGFSLLRLDLQFWWYYLLQGLLLALGYLDVLLTALGAPLPMGETGAFFLCFALQMAGQYILFVRAKPLVETSYALFYLQLQDEEEAPAQVLPKNHPWDD